MKPELFGTPCPVHPHRSSTVYGVCSTCHGNIKEAAERFLVRGTLPHPCSRTAQALRHISLPEKPWNGHQRRWVPRNLTLRNHFLKSQTTPHNHRTKEKP